MIFIDRDLRFFHAEAREVRENFALRTINFTTIDKQTIMKSTLKGHKNNLSSSYQNQVMNDIKLFYRSMYHSKLDIELIYRPKKEKTLPNVLNKEEVKKIITVSTNLKHRTMLSLLCACGLRRSEILGLRRSRTTKIYTHVRTHQIKKIISPIDTL